ncbi:MAG: hypothetical protein VX913_05215, partial [Planctomycetota bacterium]|nr:hypothetical protein [Planctomycetota bacterium]
LAFVGQNPTKSAVINYYLGAKVTGDVQFRISGVSGDRSRNVTVKEARPGVGKLEWDMRYDAPKPAAGAAQASGRGGGRGRGRRGGRSRGPAAGPGPYRVEMTVNGETYTGTIRVRRDPMLGTR